MAYYSTAKIMELQDENYRVRTFTLDADVEAQPGQFVMVWLPGVDEKPMCVVNAKPLMISVAKVGPFTQKIFELKQGDQMSFRGPLGKSFELNGARKICLVGGGYGVAALNFLAKQAREKSVEVTMIIGAREKKDVIFGQKFSLNGVRTLVSTDDGSEGFRGRAHELLEKLFAEGQNFDCVYACGPEKMMEAVGKVCASRGVECQLSVERYMGCGLGVCGKCDCGGKLVCFEGPVFTGKEAALLAEFGKSHRDTMGHRHDW